MADVVMQVVRRCTFGFAPALYGEVQQVGPEAWLDAQLRPETIPDDEVEAQVATLFPSLQMEPGERSDMQGTSRFALEWRHSLLLRAVRSRRQLQEVMVHVWYDHFNTSVREQYVAMGKADEDRFLRANALGRFSELLKGMAAAPTMLYYLDGVSNKTPRPNENFARELLELHTVGLGQFSENDVRDAARVFTGWNVQRNTFYFDSARHDAGPATVLGWSTPGRAGESGVLDGFSLLDHLASHPATAKRVAERLVRRFVADDPPADLVDAVALAYRSNATEIVPMLRAIFQHDAFVNATSPKFQRPFELLAAGLRVTEAEVDWSPASESAQELSRRLNELNHLPGEELLPAGFSDRADAWVGAGDLLLRWELMGVLGGGEMPGARVDLAKLMGSPIPSTVGELVDRLSKRLFNQVLPIEKRRAMFRFVGKSGTAPVDAALLRARLGPLVGLLLASPEFGNR